MVCHGLGPARQRGAIGLMGAMTLGIALLFMLLVVDSGRLYLEKRKLQRVADTAALEVVTRGTGSGDPRRRLRLPEHQRRAIRDSKRDPQ